MTAGIQGDCPEDARHCDFGNGKRYEKKIHLNAVRGSGTFVSIFCLVF